MFQFNLICQINKTNLYTLNFAWNNLLIVLTSHYLFNPIYFYQFISQLYQCFLYCYILSMRFFLWSTYSFYDNLCVYDTFFAIAKVASNVICWQSNGYFVAIVPHNPMPKGQNFPHTISISAMATPLPIHCSNCLSTLWEYHTLSAAC